MTFVLVGFAILLLLSAALFARVTTQHAKTLASVAELALPVDIAALSALLNHEDDAFLRSQLTGRVYRKLRRRRSRLVLSYVNRMLHNTSVVISFAATVREQGDARQMALATDVVHVAMRARLRLAAVAGRAALDWALPVLPISRELVQPYLQLQDRASLLFRTLDPAQSSQAVAAL